jgi:hypothetical protein
MTAPIAAQAEDPGAVLRRYLQARMQGDLESAARLWDRRDEKRAGAMGIRFSDIEASYDDYWMRSADERGARAAAQTVSVQDSVTGEGHAYFTVALESPEPALRDTLRYFLQQSGDTWHVSLPYLHATRGWTRREGRFVRLRSKRLVDVSTAGLYAMDAAIEKALEQLHAPPSALLRLERIKLDYYLCDSADDVRALVGSTRRAGYLPAGQRIVTRARSNMNAVARALVHLAMRQTPLRFAPLFEEGLATALGGSASASALASLRRARNLAFADPEVLALPLESVALDAKNAVPMASVWCSTLLSRLSFEELGELLRSTGGTTSQVEALETDALLRALRQATGVGRREMLRSVQAHLGDMEFAMQPGCEQWPAEIRGLNALMQWRDSDNGWALMGYVVDDSYLFTVAAHVPGPPVWMRDLVDSLQAEYTDNALEWVPPAQGANPILEGDPPVIVMVVRAKLEEDVEVYESELFAEHFLQRNYKNDLFGLFVSPDDARLYDYSQDKLIAEFSARSETGSDLVFYDEAKQRICFRFPLALIPRQLTAYYVDVQRYSGE